jgi:glycosyltransferase involved in cell wall biosynthesis
MRTLHQPPGAVRRLSSVPPYLHALGKWLAAEEPDVVHVNTLPGLPEAVVARAAGWRVLLHVHEMLGSSISHRLAGRIVRRYADVVVAVSRASANALARHGIRASIVPNGIAVPVGVEGPVDGRPLVVGFLGTVSRRKGTDTFLVVARRIREQLQGIEFRIVGPAAGGPEARWAGDVLAVAHSQGVEHRLATDVPRELAEWHMLLLPSREDPFPLVVLEAMAAGLPIVATAVDGIAEQLTPATGILVEEGDADGLTAAVRDLLTSPARRAALGAAARERVAREFTLERQAKLMEEAYAKTVRASRARRVRARGQPR